MRRLIWLAVFAAAAWYGWHHWRELRGHNSDEAVIENDSGHTMLHVSLNLGERDLAGRDSISAGASSTVPFVATHDGTFHLHWLFPGSDIDHDWTGGEVTAGPVLERHVLQVQLDGGVVARVERIAAPAAH